MKRCSTILLRCAIIFAGVAILALCGGITYWIVSEWTSTSDHHFMIVVLFAGIYSSAIPFFIALYQGMKLLAYIDANRAFSELSVKALKTIMYCAIVIFAVCTVGGLPFFYYWADLTDAPGLMLIGMVIDGVAFVIAIFASVLKRLLQDAIEVKSENDLTI